MEILQKKEGKIAKVRSIRIPEELATRIEADAQKQDRDFTKQVVYIIRKYYDLIDNK